MERTNRYESRSYGTVVVIGGGLVGAEMPTNTSVLEIRDDGGGVEENGTSRTLPAGLVVTAIGSRPNAAPAKKLKT
jgi:NADH dehydrogenase FAD-containing subunit